MDELKSLIQLLDDPDPRVFSDIRDRILWHGATAIPLLELAWENSFDKELQYRVEELIHFIQFSELKSKLETWKKLGSDNLLRGTMLIAQYHHPDMNEDEVIREIGKISQDIWLELSENLNPLEKIRVFNKVFYNKHLFKGNKTNYHAPQNSFINKVLETRKGNPVSLSIIYLLIARKLNMPLYGIDLPEHFILGFRDKDDGPVQFFINTFSKGAIFTKGELLFFMRQMKIEPETSHLLPCSNIDIIIKLLSGLLASFEKLGHEEKIGEIKELIQILKNQE